MILNCCWAQSRRFCWEKGPIEVKMENNDNKDYDREKVTEELYRRFSKRGLWRLRTRRFMRGFTWIFVVQLLSGAKRLLGFLLSLFLLLILWPILLLTYFIPGTTLKRTPRVGRWCVTFNAFSFETSDGFAGRILTGLRLTNLPVLINILKGDISFIGPRAVSPGDLSPRERRRASDTMCGPGCFLSGGSGAEQISITRPRRR